jgi:phenylalanyl-tRNA synthetase alpha chain
MGYIKTMAVDQIQQILKEALEAFQKAQNVKDLYDLKVQFFGKQGSFSSIMKSMKDLPNDQKPLFGQKVNEAKKSLEESYEKFFKILMQKEIAQKLSTEKIDVTLPGPNTPRGTQHPISMVIDEIASILSRLGYSVRLGPLIETDFYNFEALNVPADHPARDMQDTFYIDDKHVLRTQTSPIQIRTMQNEKPPLRVIGPGSVFRHDSDISHAPMFHQIEGLYIDKKVSMAELKATLTYFTREFFGGSDLKTRFRPSFFPFTEPSAEVDGTCPFCMGRGCRMCKQSGWIELGGCGLVHPNVLKTSGLDPSQWQGFAFGFGVERMAILKYGIEDIRLFAENDVRFLEQFT